MPQKGCKKPSVSKKLQGRKMPEKVKLKIGKSLSGKKKSSFTEQHKLNLSKSLTRGYEEGRIHWLKGEHHSLDSRRKMSETRKGKKTFRNKDKCNFWKGGITSINRWLRTTVEYKLWRLAIFERDNFTCVFCKTRGGKLNADHIKPFSLFPSLRLNLENGRTLCINCHKKTETYGGRLNNVQFTKEEYEAKMKEINQ